MPNPNRILVTRFSALGDVAMTIPVIQSFAKQFPQYELVYVSQTFAQPLIRCIPGVTFVPVDLKNEHKGVLGMWKLSRQLAKSGRWIALADLHDVHRTKLLRIFLRLNIPKFAKIDKGRREKKLLTRRNDKVHVQLKHTVTRYIDVFNKLGFKLNIHFHSIVNNLTTSRHDIFSILGSKNNYWVGIAPFAKHQGKAYPIEKMQQVIDLLSKNGDVKVILFGGGKKENEGLLQLEKQFPCATSVAGKFTLDGELRLMSMLDAMISMDSANMHLASLVNTRVISIWGATHPHAGFLGFNQRIEDAIQDSELECRPCSVFGNKPCFRKDYACLYGINPKDIVHKVNQLLVPKR